MSRRKLDGVNKEDVLEAIARFDRRGYTQVQIAAELKVSQPVVSSYLKTIRDRYAQAQVASFEAKVNEKIAQYREVMQQAWMAWELSKSDAKREVKEQALRAVWADCKKTGERISKGEKLKLVKAISAVEGRLPANEYLATIVRCLVEMTKLEGLVEPDTPVGNGQLQIDFLAVMKRAMERKEQVPLEARILQAEREAIEARVKIDAKPVSLNPDQVVIDVTLPSKNGTH